MKKTPKMKIDNKNSQIKKAKGKNQKQKIDG